MKDFYWPMQIMLFSLYHSSVIKTFAIVNLVYFQITSGSKVSTYPSNSGNAKAMCPYDPFDNTTAVYSSKLLQYLFSK